MPVTAAPEQKKPALAAETPCVHCGLPVGTHPAGRDPYFCCTGCQVVYETLHAAGYGDTYYRLRQVAPDRSRARPADTRIDDLQISELDTEAFLAEHTRPAGEKTRAVDLFLDGVHCAACVWLVEQLPYVMDGVLEARLDLPRARLTLHFLPEKVRLSEVSRWLARFGYTAHPTRRHGMAERTDAERHLLVKVGVCWALAANVMLLAAALYSGLDFSNDPSMATAARWMSLLLAVPSILYGGSEVFRRAWASLRLALQTRNFRSLHMDTPIALGILVGSLHSAWATVTGRGEVWFDSITVLIAALLTARWLQLRSRRLAGDATERLLSLIPSMVRQVRETGEIEVVKADTLFPEDVVEVPAGEVFPVDGLVVSGSSRVNKAVLTGESRPEAIAPGTFIEAGATNLSAPVRVQVRAAGDQTRVGKLLAWIRDQETRKAPVMLLADRLSGYFVLAVLFLAAATAALWLAQAPSEAVQHVVALLVITCPCALGMATPLAMAVAAGQAARTGIFIKSDEATQLLTEIDVVVLDKTGTLTEGRMALVEYEGDEQAIDLAAALETHSNHPIAVALVQARGACRLDRDSPSLPEIASLEVVSGLGIQGQIGRHRVAVGQPEWIAPPAGAAPGKMQAALARYSARGDTPVAVAVDGQVAAVLAFGDRIRASSRPIIQGLQAQGKAVYVLSGDHPEVAASVAHELGIAADRAHGRISPEEKQAFVEQLRSRGSRVAMVGDGVNDAAALQAADVGIAVQGGSTASLVAADVFLTRAGLVPLQDLLTGSRRVMSVVRRNLTLSLIYNLIGAAAAIAGLVTPLVAAVAMPVSSLLVVTSSILQRSFRPAHGASSETDA